MNYLEWGTINHSSGQSRAYFVGSWNRNDVDKWNLWPQPV